MATKDEVFLKILILGDSGVGKTCILNKYCYEQFDSTAKPTIGCDFTMKLAKYESQERYKCVSKLYIRGAHGCIIVTDITDKKSLDESLEWKKIVEEHFQTESNIKEDKIPYILLQNKYDKIQQIESSALEEYQTPQFIQEFAKQNNFSSVYQISAKTSHNLNSAMDHMIQMIYQNSSTYDNTFKNNNNIPEQLPQTRENNDSFALSRQNSDNISLQKNKKNKCC